METSRISYQALDEIGENGFSDEERMAIAGFMSAVVADADWDNRLGDYEGLSTGYVRDA